MHQTRKAPPEFVEQADKEMVDWEFQMCVVGGILLITAILLSLVTGGKW